MRHRGETTGGESLPSTPTLSGGGSYLSTETNGKAIRRFVGILHPETCATDDFCVFFTVQSGSELNIYSTSFKNGSLPLKGSTLSREKKFSRRFQDITKVCRHLFRIISIRRNKRQGHTTFC